METLAALDAFTALAHPHRLAAFRYLVRAGDGGSPVTPMRETLDLPGATLSHHLAILLESGLVIRQRDGRQLIYRADFARMRDLTAFLSAECCAGGADEPVEIPPEAHPKWRVER